ncbi:MAG TPA: hybrid sensor histidine kinase/response regulator [Methylibium sp.]
MSTETWGGPETRPEHEGRSSFVAVEGAADSDADSEAAPRRPERRAVDRRLRDAALPAAARASPVVLVAVLAGLLAGINACRPAWPGWSALWAVFGLASWGAWSIVALYLPQFGAGGAKRAWLRPAFPWLGGVCLLSLAFMPWLPGLSESQRWIMLACLGVVALAGAAQLAALPVLAGAAVALPLSVAIAAPVAPVAQAQATAALAICALAALLAQSRCRSWIRVARALIEREDRLRVLETERDTALRADQEKSRFLAIASHDLRQPVHALGLFAATLERRLQGTAEEPLVRNVMQAIDGLDRSFNAMLDISRLDAGTVAPNIQRFPLRDLFRRLHMHFAGQAELAGLSLRFSPGGKWVSSDPQLLERILGNLIQNAIKYTPRGGIVVVARSTRAHTNVEVWDTGVGMRAAELPRIFDEFYQVGHGERRRSQGLGMGLAIVKRLARLLGHGLTVSSQPGRGTMFRLSIAVGGLAGIQDATAAADTLPMPVLQARTVLIIDDEEAICAGLSLLLEEWGYQTASAGSLEQAQHTVRGLAAPPDLILSDLHLGGGPDGIAAIEALRRQFGYDVPAILITGDTSHQEMRRATDSGHPVLFKPVQARKLLNALRGLVS